MRNRIPVYLLAGGRSQRYGSDKARLRIGGQRLLVRIARELGEIASTTSVVVRSPGEHADLGFRTVADSLPGQGPLGGLLTALEDAGPDAWVFLAACDQVGIRASWARTLLRARREEVRAVVYRSDRFHPLFALYHGSLAPEVRQRVRAGELKMQHLLDRVPAAVLPTPEGWEEMVNLNRPAAGRKLGG